MQTSVKAKCPPGLEMSAHILTSGYWPSYPVLDANLPAELTQYQVEFMSTCSSHSFPHMLKAVFASSNRGCWISDLRDNH